jgi:hypothetical protein
MNEVPRFFVLDAEDRIVQVSEKYHENMGPFLGHPLWEFLPRAEFLFRPHLEEARRTGRPVESTIFYAGRTVDLRIVPSGESLAIHPTSRTELNVRTLATLAESLSRIEAELDAREPERRDPPAPASLQALP